MISDELVRNVLQATLELPDGSGQALVRHAEASPPGDHDTGDLVLGIHDLRTNETVSWTVPKEAVSAALTVTGDDASVDDLIAVLSKLYADRVGEFDLSTAADPDAEHEGLPQAVGRNDRHSDSDGDIEDRPTYSGGPGDPDLDF